MKKMVTAISLIAMLMFVASTALAHNGAHEGKSHGMYEEGSGGSAMEMDRKSHTIGHEYKGEGSGGMEHSKEYYEKKYGKYDHKKHEIQEEGSAMKEEVMKMRKMQHQRMEKGSQ